MGPIRCIMCGRTPAKKGPQLSARGLNYPESRGLNYPQLSPGASIVRERTHQDGPHQVHHVRPHSCKREFFMDSLLVRIHLIIEIILVNRPCAMGV